jgi:hypothetical protein
MIPTQNQALEAALSALESERIMAADAQGNYTVEVTPNRILDAIAKVKAALAEPEQSQPREWQELSEDEALEAFNRSGTIVDTSPIEQYVICQFISAALRAKNGG